MGHSRPALPPASSLGWRPMNGSVGGYRSWQRNRCTGWGWVRTDHITPNWPVSEAHLILLHNPESKEQGEWGKEEEEGSEAVILCGGGEVGGGEGSIPLGSPARLPIWTGGGDK